MSNNPTDNNNEKKREYCGSDKTFMDVTKNGTPYSKWYKSRALLQGR